MLRSLFVRNFILIDQMNFDLGTGLNVLSGETGAGKSILIQAIHFILGARGDLEWIRKGEDETEGGALFEVPSDHPVLALLSQQGIESEGELVIRRLFQQGGKSRAWINQRPVTVGFLQQVGIQLIQIVGQHQIFDLFEIDSARIFLDQFTGHPEKIDLYRQAFHRYSIELNRLKEIEQEIKKLKEREDFYLFQLKEIEDAALQAGEEETLKEQKKRLLHTSKIQDGISKIHSFFEAEEVSVSSLLGRAFHEVSRLREYDSDFELPFQKLESIQIDVESVLGDFKEILSRYNEDPDVLDKIESRLEQIQLLKKKYGSSIEEILQKKETLRQQVHLIQDGTVEIEACQASVRGYGKNLIEAAKSLSESRHQGAKILEKKVQKELHDLFLVQARFKVEINSPDWESCDPLSLSFTEVKTESIDFMFSSNKGEDLKPLSKVASGGELSRVHLVLRSLVQIETVSTVLFDEIDTGVSGAVAQSIGRKLKELSSKVQVLCITHLPQIAAFADHHFQISKGEKEGRMITQLQPLKSEERIQEIARMIAGIEITENALLHATELLQTSQNLQAKI